MKALLIAAAVLLLTSGPRPGGDGSQVRDADTLQKTAAVQRPGFVHQTGTVQPATAVRPATAVKPASAVLTGRVTDAGTGESLSGAQIQIDGTAMGALSNTEGRYVIRVPAGELSGQEIELRAALIGYAEIRRTVTLTEGTAVVDFALEPSTPDLNEIVVGGEDEERSRIRRETGNAAPGVRPRGQSSIEAKRDAAGSRVRVEGMATPTTNAPPPYPNAEPERGAYGDARHNRWRHRPDSYPGESYARIVENRFLAARNEPLSTFSIDVDRASYANVRRYIRDGMRPPVDAVRIEEMVNYFSYDYADPRTDHPFAVHTEVAPAPWNDEHRLVRIGIQGDRVDMEDIPASNLVFLLDVSGSMSSEDKLPLLKTAFRMLVRQLRPQDRVAIVVYAGAAGLVLPSTSGAHRGRILQAIDRLESGGSTAGGAGIKLAYDVARKNHIDGGNNRVILATDGDFNVGASSDADMVRLIEAKRRQGTFLTVLGFGTGNLQDAKMESIADHGNGNYAYIDNAREARKVLVTEMGGTLLTIAKDVKIQVEFNPARVAAHRLIGYENRMLAAEDFNDDTKDAGELGAGHTVTALYEIVPVGAEWTDGDRSVDPLRYRRNDGDERRDRRENSMRRDDFGERLSARAGSKELMFVKLRYKTPEGKRSRLIEHPVADRVEDPSRDLRFAAAVAAFGMLLRDSEYCRDFSLNDVARLARSGEGEDLEGYRREFVELVEDAKHLRVLAMEHY